jgi:NADPH:quinone reductase-like Zn-dependent oxidoreductase
MKTVTTDAWVIYHGPTKTNSSKPVPAELVKEEFTFPDIGDYEVLAETIYGSWEANMTHALQRQPVDICRQRGEEKAVIGNAGVVRILRAGDAVKSVTEGDMCLVFCNGVWDRFGYPEKIFAYDAPNTIGLLAKRTKLHEKQIIPIPKNSLYGLEQWAAFSLRYITAWANWKKAYGCWRSQFEDGETPPLFVWGWGGGVSLAELALARHFGAQVAMTSSDDRRLETIRQMEIEPVDRRLFIDLNLDEARYNTDVVFRKAYQQSEEIFLSLVKEHTQGMGVSIFIDYIGAPVFRATLKALSRQGIITTAGWKKGMKTSTIRAVECMKWHTHVHTHYAPYAQGVKSVSFAEENGWLPVINSKIYSFDEIPRLAQDYAAGKIDTYFPIFQVNPV